MARNGSSDHLRTMSGLPPNFRHLLAYVRYRAAFVRATPSNRRSRWGREMTGFDPLRKSVVSTARL